MLSGENIIMLGSEKWLSGNQTSKHHLAKQFTALGAKVLYIENVSMRKIGSGGKSDLSKVQKVIRAISKGVHSPLPNLFCYTPLYLPNPNSVFCDKINRFILPLQIRFLKKKLGLRTPIFLSFIPTGAYLQRNLAEKLSVYYVVDNFAAFEDVEQSAVARLEMESLRKSDIVFATAETIMDRLSAHCSNMVYSPHGVDFDLFASVQAPATVVADELKNIRSPVIGFMGSLASDSVDLQLIKRLAVRRPDWSFVLVGRQSSDITFLEDQANIHIVDQRPYHEMPRYLKAFDVALIPFLENPLTLDLNPIKLREYLAAGLPTVATRLPAIVQYEPQVKCVESSADEEWIDAIECYLSTPGDPNDRQNRVRAESWESRAQAIAKQLKATEENLARKARG